MFLLGCVLSILLWDGTFLQGKWTVSVGTSPLRSSMVACHHPRRPRVLLFSPRCEDARGNRGPQPDLGSRPSSPSVTSSVKSSQPKQQSSNKSPLPVFPSGLVLQISYATISVLARSTSRSSCRHLGDLLSGSQKARLDLFPLYRFWNHR